MGLFSFLKRPTQQQPTEKKDAMVVMPKSYFDWDLITGTGSYRLLDFYEKVWNIYRCITLISRKFSTIPYELVKRAEGFGKEDKEVTDHPVTNLLQYKVTPIHSGADFLEGFSSHSLINGNGYGHVIGTRERPVEIWNYPSQYIEPIQGDSLIPIKHYAYKTANIDIKIPPEEMIHNFFFHPSNMIKGLSPMSVARRIANTQELTERWNEKLLENNATPSLILSFLSGLTADQRTSLQKQIDEEWTGVDNARKVHVIEGKELKVDKLSFSPQDLDWINSQKMTMRYIGQIFGVDSSLLGDYENKTYANMKEARKSLYTETIIPFAEKIFQTMAFFFFWDKSKRRTTHYFRVKTGDIEALQVDLKEQALALKEMWWLTPNEKLEMQGLPQDPDPLMDKRYFPMNLVPIDELGDSMEGI